MSMLKAIKGNKIYTISEVEKKTYLEQGFDIYEGDKLIEHSPLKTIKYNEYLKVVAEKDAKIAELEKELEALKTKSEIKAESATTKKGK